ncbi:DUF602-domain-containing protein [Glonium stellatum]|uniref:DUF602-domain-containing protein n=1 Tax=Glonium stellatum TaxID=574774 RepID=A0A8E2JQX4_9PEZI|nr:DUF602-domain-containing protein [Glonium stellatum]
MGNDGGSIPTRRELVKEAARALTTTQLKETQQEQQSYAWNTDPLTRKPLARPVVSDAAGKLYNKDAILEYLLPADDGGAKKLEDEKVLEGRVRSLKDVVEVKFEIEVGGVESVNGGVERAERWVCPITRRELGPGAKAVYLVPCGHAFAGSVVKEVSGETCLQCNEPYAENDVIPILPTAPTDIARLSLRMKTLKEKGLTHSLKKASGSKKRKKNAEKEAAAAATSTDVQQAEETKINDEREEEKKIDRPARPSPSTSLARPQAQPAAAKSASSAVPTGIKNAATASLTAKVLEEQEARNKRRKVETNENLKSLFSSRDPKQPSGKSSDFMTRGFSIPANARR